MKHYAQARYQTLAREVRGRGQDHNLSIHHTSARSSVHPRVTKTIQRAPSESRRERERDTYDEFRKKNPAESNVQKKKPC